MCFLCLQFPPKNERKQVDLRFHSSKVEFFCSFLEESSACKNHYIGLCLTFRKMNAGFPRILLDLPSFEALGGLALPGWRGSKIFLGQCFSVGMYPHVYVRLW